MLKKALVAAILISLLSPISPIFADSVPSLSVSYLSGITAWGDSTPATIGDTVDFYIEVHNTTVSSRAENLTVRVALPSSPSGGTIVSTATVSGSQASASDSTSVINLPENALLQYQSGSLRITADLDGNGAKEYNNYAWPNDSITTTGVNLGTLTGGDPAVVQLSFKAKVEAGLNPNLTVSFLSGNPERPADGWSDNTGANPGNATQYYIEIHNTNMPSSAKDLRVRVSFPNNETGTVFQPIAYASYSPYATSVSDGTKVTFSATTKLTYRSGSLKITWDKNGDGVKEYDNYVWPNDDLIAAGGITLGDLWGCNPYIIQLSFWADSSAPSAPSSPSLAINKKVVWQGNEYDSVSRETHLYDPREEVKYKIYVKNEGNAAAKDVVVVDHLPTYIRDLDGRDRKEFNVGTLEAGKTWVGEYTAKVVADIPQNDRTQENRATVDSNEGCSDEDTAFIWINGPEILAAVAPAAAAAELPATGPAVPVALGLAGMLPVGVLLRRAGARKFLKFLR